MYDYGTSFLKMNIINGYKFSPFYSLGLGISLRYYYDEKDAIIPLFMDFRAFCPCSNISLYSSLEIGYSLDIERDFEIGNGGFLLNTITGAAFRVSKRTSLMVGIGYELQESKILRIG